MTENTQTADANDFEGAEISDSAVPVSTQFHRRPRRRKLSVVLVAIAVALLASAAPAHAYTAANNGYWGNVSLTPAYVNLAPSYPVNSRTIVAPTVYVSRNASAAPGLPQKVLVVQDLYRSLGSSWNYYSSNSTQTYINYDQASKGIQGFSFVSVARGYYYEVLTTIIWYDNNNNPSGKRVIAPSATSDWKCTVASCTSYGGPVWIG